MVISFKKPLPFNINGIKVLVTEARQFINRVSVTRESNTAVKMLSEFD